MTDAVDRVRASGARTAERRGGLGRGLGALIPTGSGDGRPADVFFEPRRAAPWRGAVSRGTPSDELVDVAGARYCEVPVDAVRPNPRQPRQVFDDEAMVELVASIREVGLLQPVVVRESGAGGYELVMGERRWRAARAAGLAVLPAIVRSTADDRMLRDALLENLHRSSLNPLEEAAAYQQLLDDFGCSHDELATRIGKSRPQVSNTLRLLRLPPSVQRRIAAGVLSAGHARALLALPDADAQERLATRIVAEGLSVRSVEEIAALGGDDGPAPRSKGHSARATPAQLAELSAALSDRFDTRVRVDVGRHKGRIVLEFASLDDLARLVELLDPAAVERVPPAVRAADPA